MIEPIARIRIELQEIEPKIWRRVDVPLSATLFALHDIIQVAMGWKDVHLFEFVVGDKIYGVPEEIVAEFVAKGETERVLAAAGASRHLLHCRSLSFRHPAEGRRITVEAPVPQDFAAFSAGLAGEAFRKI